MDGKGKKEKAKAKIRKYCERFCLLQDFGMMIAYSVYIITLFINKVMRIAQWFPQIYIIALPFCLTGFLYRMGMAIYRCICYYMKMPFW